MKKTKILALGACCAMGGAALFSPAYAAGTPDPGDYIPAPPGTTILATYVQHITADKVYVDGHEVADDLGLTLDVGVARLMHYFEVNGKPMDFELILPYARQRIDAADFRESGLGNLQVGSTYYSLADDLAGRYWAWAAYLSLPTGQKKREGLAVSEDRYALDIETAYITPLSERWSVDLIGQAEFYTDDDITRVKRQPFLRGMAHLNYALSDATRLSLSLRQAYGARETLDGQTVLGSKNDTSLGVTWAHQLTGALQLQLQYVQDVSVRNGVPAQTFQVRTAFVF